MGKMFQTIAVLHLEVQVPQDEHEPDVTAEQRLTLMRNCLCRLPLEVISAVTLINASWDVDYRVELPGVEGPYTQPVGEGGGS